METNNIINSYNNNNNKQNNPDAIKIQKNTIKEEEHDEELDQSYRSHKVIKSDRAAFIQENEINEDSENDEYIDQKNISFEEDEEEDQGLIDFNDHNAYESENSQEQNEETNEQENPDLENNREAEDKENEEIKNAG
jgi:hypothetical protein